jgi:hypothetical protein
MGEISWTLEKLSWHIRAFFHLSLTLLSGCIFTRLRASYCIAWRVWDLRHQGVFEQVSLACYSWMLPPRRRFRGCGVVEALQRDTKEPQLFLLDFLCSLHTKALKGNSSEIKIWRGTLIQAGSKINRCLDRGAIEHWIHLNVDHEWLGNKSSIPQNKIRLLSSIISLLYFFQAIYFEQFTFYRLNCTLSP